MVLLALLVGVVADAAAAAVAFLERCIVVKVDTLRSDDVVVCHPVPMAKLRTRIQSPLLPGVGRNGVCRQEEEEEEVSEIRSQCITFA